MCVGIRTVQLGSRHICGRHQILFYFLYGDVCHSYGSARTKRICYELFHRTTISVMVPWRQPVSPALVSIGNLYSPKYIPPDVKNSAFYRFLITDKNTFFDEAQRIRIAYEVLQRTKCDPDDLKKRGIQWLIKKQVYLTAYPLHDGGLDVNLPKSKFSRFKEVTSQWSRRQVLRAV